MKPRIISVVIVLVMALIVSFLFAVGSFVAFLPYGKKFENLAISSPHPHHVPTRPGGISFRFVMAHDVIHERFPKHGVAYYEARNQQTRSQLDELEDDDRERWPLIDDLCVGLEKLGRTEEAIPLMRSKLEQQQAAGITGIDLYSSFANLGTFLIHANFANARLGEAAAIQKFQEGVDFIREAVEVNPDAHFGRERWQLAVAEFLLVSFESPEVLEKFDCIGNRIDLLYDEIMDPGRTYYTAYGHASSILFANRGQRRYPAFFPPEGDPSAEENWEQFKEVRKTISKVGAGEPELAGLTDWQDLEINSHKEQVPFDEPMLGIIGMWREGGGANPHFALAIGETMLRVGQRFIAWTAYERAFDLAERYSPDPALQEFLRNHCRERQAVIAQSLLDEGEVFNPEEMRRKYRDELDFGLEYQDSYQAFEEQQLAAGVEIDDPNFYAGFHQTAPEIATKPGREELMRYAPVKVKDQYVNTAKRNWTIFGAGIGAMIPAVFGYLRRRFFRSRVEDAKSHPVT